MINNNIDIKEVICFFNKLASQWDERRACEDNILNEILDKADISQDKIVLDIACGTGALIPYYLNRDVKKVIGLDISEEMIRIAREKFLDNRVEFICDDATTVVLKQKFDCCMVCNALSHFDSPEKLIKNIEHFMKNDGRLTITYDMNKDRLNELHGKSVYNVAKLLLHENELAKIMSRWFDVDTIIADEKMYIVSGVKKSIC